MSPLWLSIAAIWTQKDRWLDLLSPAEHATFSKLLVPKRQQDFLAGRVAARRAAQVHLGLPLDRFEIRIETGATAGRPQVVWGSNFLFASITHAEDLAGAMVSTAPIGLDVEPVVARDASFERLAFGRPLNLSAMAQTERWCQLEAYAKWLGAGLRASFDQLHPPTDLPQKRGQVRHRDQDFVWVACGAQ